MKERRVVKSKKVKTFRATFFQAIKLTYFNLTIYRKGFLWKH